MTQCGGQWHRSVGRLLLTLALGSVGAWLAHAVDVPAAPLLGAMAVTVVASLGGLPLLFPRWLRRCVVVYIGLNVGAALDFADLAGFADWLPSALGLLVSLPASLALVSWLLRRYGGFSRETAFFAAYPGHLVLVLQVAARGEADVQRVTMTQSLRVLVLVGVLPAVLNTLGISGEAPAASPPSWSAVALVTAAGLGGVAVISRLRLPAPWIMGPMIGAAAASVAGAKPGDPPVFFGDLAMMLTGAMIGTRLVGARVRTLLRVLPVSLLAVAMALAVAAAFAVPVSLAAGIPLTKLLLAYAPGGADVMAIVALATGQDPAFVGLHHLLRLLVMALALPFLAKRLGPVDHSRARRVGPGRRLG